MDTNRGNCGSVERISFAARSQPKGQVAVEFLMYTGVFLFILLAAFSLIQLLQNSEIPAQEGRILYEQGNSMAQVLQLSVLAGGGYRHELALPQKLLGRTYQIEFKSDARGARMVISGTTSTGTADYIYTLPPYQYSFTGCLDQGDGRYVFISDRCSGTLKIINDGQTLGIQGDRQ